MKKPKWKIETVALVNLKPADYNPRKPNKRARAKFKENFDTFGNLEALVVNKDYTIIGGHQRYEIFLEQGKRNVEVSIPDRQLSQEEEKNLNIILNSVTGTTDVSKLLEAGITQEVLDEIGYVEVSIPEIKAVDKPVVQIGIEKNQSIYALFFEPDEYTMVKRVLSKVMVEEGLENIPETIIYLIKNYG